MFKPHLNQERFFVGVKFMSKRERKIGYTLIDANIVGCTLTCGNPLEMTVQGRENPAGDSGVPREPFSAFTSRVIKKFIGINVVLAGGTVIPFTYLCGPEATVRVRLYSESNKPPRIELGSLIRLKER